MKTTTFAFAVIDPCWGQPSPIIETIRDTAEAAVEAAILLESHCLYSGSHSSFGVSIAGSWERMESYGYKVESVQIIHERAV
ncbi:MAG: hypothetical protein ACEQSB_00695 [Undibacterium sp.]